MVRDVLSFDHNKNEFPPSHTTEHLLNQTMIRMFGCDRSCNAHIERRKCKMDFSLDHKPDRKEEKAIEDCMNRLIEADLPVTFEVISRKDLMSRSVSTDEHYAGISLDRLPKNASDTIRIVRIGNYDVCPCVGNHVRSTLQIGHFKIIGTSWNEQERTFRIRFRVTQ